MIKTHDHIFARFFRSVADLFVLSRDNRRNLKYMNDTAKKFNSTNIVFTHAFGHFSMWIRSRKNRNELIHITSWQKFEDIFAEQSFCIQQYLSGFVPDFRADILPIGWAVYAVEPEDLNFMEAISRFNGSSIEEFKVYMDLIECNYI